MEVYEDTGVTFSTGATVTMPEGLGKTLVRRPKSSGVYGLLLVGAIILFIAAANMEGFNATAFAVVGALLVASWIAGLVQVSRINRAGERLGELLEQALSSGKPLSSDHSTDLAQALSNKLITSNDRSFQTRRAYLGLVSKIVEDRLVGAEELTALEQVEKLFGLNAEFSAAAREDTFRDAYLEAIADNALTADEEVALDGVRRALSIPESAIEVELNVMERLREIRAIRDGQVPTVTASVSLQESEVCHYEGLARVLKENNLRSYQQNGQKYKVRGLVISDEGTLLVTNKRVLVVHQGTTTVKYDKILDLEVDYDRNLLIITKDGAKTPMLITTPNAMKAGAIIAAIADL